MLNNVLCFQDFKKNPYRLVNHKLLSDLVGSQTEDVMVSRSFPHGSTPTLEAPGATPWFDTWTKLYIHSIGASEHEYVRHHLGCIFIVSTSNANVMEQFRQLTETQYNHHHQKPNSFPQYIQPNILKYYVLVHDVYEGNVYGGKKMIVPKLAR